ncbi:lysostaphin resistance A-like protein [Pontibacter sp. CAU 1760]
MKQKSTVRLPVSFLRKSPVAAFTLLAFLFSYGGWLVWQALPFTIGPTYTLLRTYLSIAVVVLGPGFAALLVSNAQSGGRGPRELLRQLRPTPKALRLLLLLPATTLLVYLATLHLAGLPLRQVYSILSSQWHYLALHYLFQIGLVGIGEELGWRGWLLPTLLQRRSRAGATGLVILIWALWHFPKLLGPPTLTLPFLVLLFALAIIYTQLWLWADRNVLVVATAHGAINAPVFFFENLPAAHAIGTDVLTYSWQLLALVYLAMTLLLLGLTRRHWWRSPSSLNHT